MSKQKLGSYVMVHGSANVYPAIYLGELHSGYSAIANLVDGCLSMIPDVDLSPAPRRVIKSLGALEKSDYVVLRRMWSDVRPLMLEQLGEIIEKLSIA